MKKVYTLFLDFRPECKKPGIVIVRDHVILEDDGHIVRWSVCDSQFHSRFEEINTSGNSLCLFTDTIVEEHLPLLITRMRTEMVKIINRHEGTFAKAKRSVQ